MWRGAASAAALVVVCAACGAASTSQSGDREWIANAHGAVRQLRDDVIVSASVDPRRALREDGSLYTALVVFTDFGGCRHIVGALGAVPARFGAAKAQLDRACDRLQLSASLFTRAVRDSSVGTMREALDTAQRALPSLDRAELRLRRQ